MRVAALADVHGNAPALEAVLEDVERAAPDLVVVCGDLTWGSLPRQTLELVRSLGVPARFVRGNAERALLELAAGDVDEPSDRERWMLECHREADLEFLAGFEPTVSLDVDGLGATCFCHGSPRSDEECVTERTSPERARAFMHGRGERVVVTAHVHLQNDRHLDGIRIVSPGSVGLPYEGVPGIAYWAILGPDVQLRQTAYDVDAAVAAMRGTGDPSVETIVELMLAPPRREDVIAHAEAHVYAG